MLLIMMRYGKSAKILIRRMKSSIKEKREMSHFTKGDYEYVREKEKKTITTINYT